MRGSAYAPRDGTKAMAEQEWYEKHKKDVAAALKKGKAAAPDAGVSCTLVRMKDGSALLCAHVSDSKATALVKEAKAQGGKVLSSGTLYKGDNGPTFAVSDGSISIKALFSAAAAEAAGSPLNVTIVAVGPAAETGTDAPVPPAPPPPSAAPASQGAEGDKTRFTDLLRQVRPRFQQVVAADPPNKATLEKGMGLAVAAAKENDFGKGLKLLQAVDAALQKTPISTGSAPPPPPPPPPPPSPPATAAIQAALAKMIPLVKSAATANPDRKSELLEPLKRCQDLINSGQAVEAKAALFDLNRVLKDLNGASPPPSPPPPTEKAPTIEEEAQGKEEEHDDAEAKEWHKRLAEVEPRYEQAVKLTTGDVGRMRMLHDIALEQADGGQYDKALATLKRLEDALAGARGTGDAIPPGLVKYRTTLLNFEKVMKTIRGQIGKLTGSVAKLPDEADLAKRLGQAVEDLNSELSDAIDKAMSAAKNVREPYNEATRGMIQEKIALIQSDPLVKIVDKNTIVPMQMGRQLVAALTEIASAMV